MFEAAEKSHLSEYVIRLRRVIQTKEKNLKKIFF